MLEFNKVLTQVQKMGAMIENLDFDLDDRLELAKRRFDASGDLSVARERIAWVRQPEVSGYRGAAPLELANAEAINAIFPAPETPEKATIIAVDGSQIYPNEQSPVHYYLINIGSMVYHHGAERVPQPRTDPDLRYHEAHVHDRYGQIIRNSTVDDRRTVEELKALAQEAWNQNRSGEATPIVGFYDNRLMYLPRNDAHDGEDLLKNYLAAMVQLHDAGAILAGYIDNPFRSKRFIQLLYLMTLNSAEEVIAHQPLLTRAGDLEGLRDQQFFQYILEPGERSAIMVQNSPQNYTFKARGENYEIAFFYLKVHNNYQSRVVRVDIPVWVARDPNKVNQLHSLILSQCQMQGRNPYPYVLTRADEMAYIGAKDRSKLEQLINTEVRKFKQETMTYQTLSAKDRGKELARGDKRFHEIDRF